MDGVKLKLNPEKNEFIIIGQKAIRESLAQTFPVPLLQNNISPSVEVKNLSVIFDSDNCFDNPVTKVCQACCYHLRDLRRMCKFLSLRLQYFWQMLWSVVVWTNVTLYFMG